jgi:hypothetical protein
MDTPRRSSATSLILILMLVATFAVLVGMFVNALGVYFVIWGTPTVTQGAIVTYQVLAVIAICLPIAGLVLSIVRRRLALGITHVALLVVVLVAALVLAVPQGSWQPKPREHHLPSNYTPCFSGSNACPGG